MLNFRNRFHGHGSLRYVYKNGRAIRQHGMTLKYIDNPRRKTPRVSVVISKKIIKSAVGRNRVRRRVYEIIRQEIPKLKPSTDVVCLIFQAEVRTQPHQELVESIQQLFRDADIYK